MAVAICESVCRVETMFDPFRVATCVSMYDCVTIALAFIWGISV